jgi:phosphoacetylglucosamine mutase
LEVLQSVPNFPKLNLGVVQTAYANGASTHYLQKVLGSDAVCITKTGVKHLHAAAHENFDIGIYFEANGHGTVLFGPKFYQAIDIAQQEVVFSHKGKDLAASAALQRLSLLPSLVNQAVGDALSDLLLVDVILTLKNWTLRDWYKLYEDCKSVCRVFYMWLAFDRYRSLSYSLKTFLLLKTDPSRQIKVLVEDRTVIETNHNETQCLSPTAVQDELNQAMQQMKDAAGPNGVARAFVRPSGTEDVVRIYAEALTRADADKLAAQAAAIVHKLCAGVGDMPSVP